MAVRLKKPLKTIQSDQPFPCEKSTNSLQFDISDRSIYQFKSARIPVDKTVALIIHGGTLGQETSLAFSETQPVKTH
jgi:hypothetical protein